MLHDFKHLQQALECLDESNSGSSPDITNESQADQDAAET